MWMNKQISCLWCLEYKSGDYCNIAEIQLFDSILFVVEFFEADDFVLITISILQ